ncbi:MAG: DUF2254 domain-containing protein [Alphaproteobacteria bacterium]|nr:DUF2254 domain-containing protein [Alphaproteobacteria bacterium]
MQDTGKEVRDPDEGYDEPTILFQKKFLSAWIAIALGISSVMASVWLVGVDPWISLVPQDAKGMLYINAEILATMLAVTLGVTLLGLQFRSQSYTMSGMMEYMNDKVIFGFIVVFIAGTAASMVVAGFIKTNYDAGWAVSFAIAYTTFSLFYHAGYIFHLVYKLQLSQMLKDNKRKMQESIERMAVIKNHEEASLGKPFEIWEGIMEKAIETDNHVIFKIGIRIIFDLLRKREYLSIYPIYKEISNYADNVCKSSMYRGRYRFMDTYIDEMLKTYRTILEIEDVFDSDPDTARLYAKKLMAHKLDELTDIMYGIIDDDEGGICCKYMEKTMAVVLGNINAPHHYEQATWLAGCIYGIIKYGILRDSGVPYMFVGMILEESKEKTPESPKFFISGQGTTDGSATLDKGHLTKWYEEMFRIIKRISIKAADDGEQFSFMDCMVVMMRLCDRYEHAVARLDLWIDTDPNADDAQPDLSLIRMFSNFISEAMNILMAQHRYSIVLAFRVKLENNMHEMARLGHIDAPGQIWRRELWVTFGDIMSRAVRADDQRTLSFLTVKARVIS